MTSKVEAPITLDTATISEVISMALGDGIMFKQIQTQHGLNADEVKALMRHHLKPGSYKAWRKRVRYMRDKRTHYK
ncbi:DUF2805 domain-containing protein [Orrella daihaiensis]|uniref:DUF2805 domain-containing protein n=1 Tax=Orrella daihaiensis TaxID=2782176 RepID=A0ABY4ALQ3_9BURK|nr:DUF2805 domain-containing protein [Orrella daihaiensis]UOD50020.1 DUF2805 domain-containing protein [Orrella daihaiensis]